MVESWREDAKGEEETEGNKEGCVARKEGVPGVLGGVDDTLSLEPFLSAGLRAARLRYSDKLI